MALQPPAAINTIPIGLNALSLELPSVKIWWPKADSPRKVNPSTYFVRACIFATPLRQFSWQGTRTNQIAQRKATWVILKQDIRKHKTKAMLKQSERYSNTLMYCMYAEDVTLPYNTVDSPLPGSEEHISAIQRQRRYLTLEKAHNRG